jgi:NAD(P)-dependent dehydrogenase (short-subunit alcohol dehydrogenase family)
MVEAGGGQDELVLITGASSGVGLHAAVAFAKAGFRTVATLRDPSKRGAIDRLADEHGVEVGVETLDVETPASIQACLETVTRSSGPVTILVNNAGAGFLGSIEQTTEADLQRVMGVNFFGVWNMTKAVLPAMRQAKRGRIITVTSIGGLIGQPFNEAYCAAKFAVEGMMEGFAPLARRMGIAVSLIEPGPINTEFVANVRATSGDSFAAMTPPYDALINAYLSASSNVFAEHGQTGADIAAIILEAARAPAPRFRYVTSDFARGTAALKGSDFLGDGVVDAFAARLG